MRLYTLFRLSAYTISRPTLSISCLIQRRTTIKYCSYYTIRKYLHVLGHVIMQCLKAEDGLDGSCTEKQWLP